MIRFAGTDCNFYSVISRLNPWTAGEFPYRPSPGMSAGTRDWAMLRRASGVLLAAFAIIACGCVAAHPIDAPRGYLPRIVRTVDSWLQSGRTPILPSELLVPTHEDSAS